MRLILARGLLLAAFAFMGAASAQQVNLPDGGLISGTVQTNVAGDQIQVFRGVPYAEPPVGERRWKPAALKPLSGKVNATNFGNICYNNLANDASNSMYPQSEDCLYLNIYTPTGVTTNSKLPVMVWIHGGAFVSGASNSFDGANLIAAAKNKLVYVSINYRLSVFGFLAGDALLKDRQGDGVNFGLRDQEVAFQWVKQYIAHFGGNPNDVTIFGESAGAKSVYAHLISRDGNQQSFHKAIAESGTYTTAHDMPTRTKQNAVFAQIATQVGCGDATTDAAERLRCLRLANSSAVWAAGGTLGWQPIVDGVFLKDTPIRRVLDGKVSPVPSILGTNTDEGWMFTQAVKVASDVMPFVRTRFSLLTDAEIARVEELYPAASFPTASDHVAEIYSDAIYVCPSELSSLVQAQNGHSTFRYRFNETSTLYGLPRAIHTAEISYVFGRFADLSQAAPTQAFVKTIQRYWTNFAMSGSPNGGSVAAGNSCGDQSADGSFQWPPYDASVKQQILLQASALSLETTGAYMPLHAERCAFWNSIEQRLAPTLSA